MPSQPQDQGWNFSSVFDLIDSDAHDIGSPTLRPEPRSSTLPEGGVGLGNFGKLYESLGIPAEAEVPPLPLLEDSELSNSDDPAAASPSIEAIPEALTKTGNGSTRSAFPDIVSLPGYIEIRTMIKDQERLNPNTIEAIQAPRTEVGDASSQSEGPAPILASTTKKQRRKLRRQAERALQERLGAESKAIMDVPDKPKMVTIPLTPSKPSRAQSNVGAKIRPASPNSFDEVPVTTVACPTPRPLHTRQRIAAIPSTPQPPQSQIQPLPYNYGTNQYANGEIPTPFQYSLAPHLSSRLQPSPMPHASATTGLIPRTVRPTTLPRQSQNMPVPSPSRVSPFSPARQPAITIRQQVDRHFHLLETLLARFPEERKWLLSPRQILNENTRAEGIHIFVDASNIMIGFKDMMRNYSVQYDMSFDSLALLMERRRPVAKRALVGSHRVAHPLPATQRLVSLAKDVGYQCDIQEQVFIAREESKKKKFFNDVNRFGWQKAIQKRTGSGSDSETGAAAAPKTPVTPKWVEQGVDELLHLKMCQSMLDTDLPSTMILATGDGAEAEMSDGFLAHVERALRKGWKVELITWKQQMNGGYKRRAFRQKWGDQFTILELDDYLEDLIDTP